MKDGDNNQHNAPISKEAALLKDKNWYTVQMNDAILVEKPETTNQIQGEDAENRPE